jgi:membrane protein DedA with SNARE-associated domain
MDFFSQILVFLKTYGAPVVLLWSLVETDLVFLVVGAMASMGTLSPVLGFLAAILGALTHDSFVFWLSKNRGGWVRSRKGYRKFADSVAKLADKTGPWQLALCRPLYGTRYPTVIYWGLRDLSYPKFVSYTLAGMLPWTLLLAAIGFQLSGHIDQFDDWLKEAKNLIFGTVFTVAVLWFLRHKLRQKNAASPGPTAAIMPEAAPQEKPLGVESASKATRAGAAPSSGNST